MHKAMVFGLLSSVLGALGLICLLTANAELQLLQRPLEAVHGLAFTLVWGFGLPEWLGYWAAGLVFIIQLVLCYGLGYKLCQVLMQRAAQQ